MATTTELSIGLDAGNHPWVRSDSHRLPLASVSTVPPPCYVVRPPPWAPGPTPSQPYSTDMSSAGSDAAFRRYAGQVMDQAIANGNQYHRSLPEPPLRITTRFGRLGAASLYPGILSQPDVPSYPTGMFPEEPSCSPRIVSPRTLLGHSDSSSKSLSPCPLLAAVARSVQHRLLSDSTVCSSRSVSPSPSLHSVDSEHSTTSTVPTSSVPSRHHRVPILPAVVLLACHLPDELATSLELKLRVLVNQFRPFLPQDPECYDF